MTNFELGQSFRRALHVARALREPRRQTRALVLRVDVSDAIRVADARRATIRNSRVLHGAVQAETPCRAHARAVGAAVSVAAARTGVVCGHIDAVHVARWSVKVLIADARALCRARPVETSRGTSDRQVGPEATLTSVAHPPSSIYNFSLKIRYQRENV